MPPTPLFVLLKSLIHHSTWSRLPRYISVMSGRLDAVPDVVIDENSRYKYVLIELTEGDNTKHIVRGNTDAEYHADVYDRVWPSLQAIGIESECKGGGRIEHKTSDKTIHVYGYSMGFGRADHQITCDVIKTKYPNYKVTWSNEGY